eukprot:UN01123
MGCCISEMAIKDATKMQQAQREAYRQNAPDPYITATGQITIPFISMVGEFVSKYPKWISDWGVNQQEWSSAIESINNETKPLVDSMFEMQREAIRTKKLIIDPKDVMAGHAKAHAQMQKVPQVVEGELYTLNQKLFEPKGLQAMTGGSGFVVFKKGNVPQNLSAFDPSKGLPGH